MTDCLANFFSDKKPLTILVALKSQQKISFLLILNTPSSQIFGMRHHNAEVATDSPTYRVSFCFETIPTDETNLFILDFGGLVNTAAS